MGWHLYYRNHTVGHHHGLGRCAYRQVQGAPFVVLGDGRARHSMSGDGGGAQLDRTDPCHLCAAADWSRDDVTTGCCCHGALVRGSTRQGIVAVIVGICRRASDTARCVRGVICQFSLAQPVGVGRRAGAAYHAGHADAVAA